MPGQLVGYCLAHVLDDDGRVEWFEDEHGQVPTYPTPAEAAAQRRGADAETWPVLELSVVPEDESGTGEPTLLWAPRRIADLLEELERVGRREPRAGSATLADGTKLRDRTVGSLGLTPTVEASP